jgi:mannitol/fructose-specific phosphotransferase system IIA component (Ntr-type)
LAKRLEATSRINRLPAFLEAVLNRETKFPTFIESVAVPHARGGAVQQLSFAVGLSAPGIPWGRDQSHIAHAVFLFAVPLREAQTYVWLLFGLSALIQDERAFMALRRASQPEQMLTIFNDVRAGRSASSTAKRGDAPPRNN